MSSKFTTVAVEEGSRETAAALLEASDAFLFDCDGTLYHAGEVLPNVAEAIAHLRRLGKSVFFVTNTSSRSKEQLRDKLCGLGIDCQAEECVPSGVFAASYIRHSHPEASNLYIIGGSGLVAEFEKLGFCCHGGPTEDEERFSEDGFKALAEEVAATRFDGVVVGWDTAITYHKITKSALVFQLHPECFFYATNDDPADRVGRCLLPGNGPLLKAVEAACCACARQRSGREKPWGHEAEVLGKPNPAYAQLIAEWHGLDLRRTVMVGDRLDTDIEMGRRAGMLSLHVLTGVDDLTQIDAKGIVPDFVLPGVGHLWTQRSQSSL